MTRNVEKVLVVCLTAAMVLSAVGAAWAWSRLGAGHTMNPPAARGPDGHWH